MVSKTKIVGSNPSFPDFKTINCLILKNYLSLYFTFSLKNKINLIISFLNRKNNKKVKTKTCKKVTLIITEKGL